MDMKWANIRIWKSTATKIEELLKEYTETHPKPSKAAFLDYLINNCKK